MKKTAKIISLALTLIMIFGVAFSLVINAGAVSDPGFTLTTTKSEDGKQLTVTVNLTSGGFGSFDGQFETSGGATCSNIKQGDTWKTFKNEQEEIGNPVVFVPNSSNGKFGVATPVAYDKSGDFIVATFDVDDSKDYSITLNIEDCKDGDGKTLTPKISNPTVSYKTSSTEPSSNTSEKTSEKSSEKSSESSSSTSQTTTTTKKTTIVKKIVPVTQLDGKAVTTPDGKPVTTVISEVQDADTDEAIVDEDAGDADDVDDVDAFDYGYITTSLTTKDNGNKKLVLNSHINPKIVIIVAIVAAILIAGIAASIILIRKRNPKEADSFDFDDSPENGDYSIDE